jgi:CheY-like chemotaxis protein
MTPARILVAEDDVALRDALKDLLVMAGHSAEVVPDGVRALEAIRQDPPDLIILDHMMPGLDGLSVLQTLKGDARLRRIPVILLTGAAQDIPRNAGAAAIIEKPFQLIPLQEQVRALLTSRRG